jgi:hypothetical protein
MDGTPMAELMLEGLKEEGGGPKGLSEMEQRVRVAPVGIGRLVLGLWLAGLAAFLSGQWNELATHRTHLPRAA